jgi:hypothetical protein
VSRAVLLDAGPLGLVTNPNRSAVSLSRTRSRESQGRRSEMEA